LPPPSRGETLVIMWIKLQNLATPAARRLPAPARPAAARTGGTPLFFSQLLN